jgi:hypothetical protein
MLGWRGEVGGCSRLETLNQEVSARADWGRCDGEKLKCALGFTQAKTPCAATLGAWKAQALAKELETMGCRAHLEGASVVLRQLNDELEHSTAFFAAPAWRLQ